MPTRRNIALGAAGAVVLAAAGYGGLRILSARAKSTETFEVTRTPEEWQKLLNSGAICGAAPAGHRASFHQPAQP